MKINRHKAYFTGFMMTDTGGINAEGIGDISDIRPELYFQVPKELRSCLFKKEMSPDQTPDYLKATFEFVEMIPVYRLKDIS